MSTTTINGSIDAAYFYEVVQLFRCWGDLPNSPTAVELQDLVLPADRARLDEAVAREVRPRGVWYLAGELRDFDLIQQVLGENIDACADRGDGEYAEFLLYALESLCRLVRVPA